MQHSAILLTCIKRKYVLKKSYCVLFEWPLKTGFSVSTKPHVLAYIFWALNNRLTHSDASLKYSLVAIVLILGFPQL